MFTITGRHYYFSPFIVTILVIMSQTDRDYPLLYGKTFVNYVTTDYYSDYLQKCEVA
jgi:hypothetical protein